MRIIREKCGMVNLITNANICANGIAVSIRTVDDMPEFFMQVGKAIHSYLGLKSVYAYAYVSDWFLRTRMGKYLI